MFLRVFGAVALFIACAACSVSGLNHDPDSVFDDPKAYETSGRLVEVIKAHDTDAFIRLAHPDIQSVENVPEQMEKFYAYLPEEPDYEVSLFYAENRFGEGEYAGLPVYLTVYDVVSPTRMARLVLAVAEHEGECCVATYWGIEAADSRPSAVHDFSFDGKGWLHFVIFVLAVGVPVFIVVTAVACVRKKHVRMKWLWVPFILVGLWGIAFNWTTGGIQNQFIQMTSAGYYIQFIKFNLLGVSIMRAGWFQPVIIEIGIPLGAFLYWVVARPAANRRRAEAEQAPVFAFDPAEKDAD